MSDAGKNYTKLSYNVLLLAVYFAFFSVQLFLRYNSSHAQLSLDLDNYQKRLTAQSASSKSYLTNTESKKNNPLSYLNKRFHPQDVLIVPTLHFAIQYLYPCSCERFYFRAEHIESAQKASLTLRGPPTLC